MAIDKAVFISSLRDSLPPVFNFSEPGRLGLVSKMTLYKARARGKGPDAINICGRLMLERESFLEWLLLQDGPTRGRPKRADNNDEP